jgi:predicted negative regulator of RcsB-dependent stress response
MAKPHPFFLLLCGLICSLTTSTASVSSAFTPASAKIYQEVLKLKVNREILKPALSAEADNAAVLLVANYADFLELCIEQDQTNYETLLDAQEQRLYKITGITPRNAWTDYAAAEVRMQVAISKLLFGNRLSAAWDFRKAYIQYTANAKQWPSFIPNRKNLGVLQVLIGSVPDQYKWFLNIIGLKGSIRGGMANLYSASSKQNPFQEEAKLLHAVVVHLVEQEKADEAIQQVTSLAKAEPDNLLYQFAAMHLLKKAKQSDAALSIYKKRPKGTPYLTFPYLHHMAADLYLYQGDYGKSIAENRLFLEQHKGRHYLKAAHFKLHMAYLLDHHQPQAKWCFNRISEVGISETEEDKYAARYAEENEKPVLPLLQARLHADGGYYHEALHDLAQLKQTPATPLPERAEYLYRKARIYHGLEKMTEAISFYRQAIALAGATTLYYAPNAALQLGYIYQEQQQPEKAKAYFRQALGYEGHAYKNSIDAKAKLALSSI